VSSAEQLGSESIAMGCVILPPDTASPSQFAIHFLPSP
jgi:hypothetical protein